jgi:hypothetical protein
MCTKINTLSYIHKCKILCVPFVRELCFIVINKTYVPLLHVVWLQPVSWFSINFCPHFYEAHIIHFSVLIWMNFRSSLPKIYHTCCNIPFDNTLILQLHAIWKFIQNRSLSLSHCLQSSSAYTSTCSWNVGPFRRFLETIRNGAVFKLFASLQSVVRNVESMEASWSWKNCNL